MRGIPNRSGLRSARLTRVLALLLVQLFSTFLLVEIGVRLLAPHKPGLDSLRYLPNVRTEYDEVETTEELLRKSMLGYWPRIERSGFVLNSRGFRTAEYTFHKPDDVYRIVVLGDSFSFASSSVPFSSMWHVKLGNLLREKLKTKVEVISLGVPAVGPRFELRLWELEGSRLKPDLVVLAFFVGNDFSDESGRLRGPGIGSRLLGVSHFLRIVRNLYRLERERRRTGEWVYVPSGHREFDKGGIEMPAYAAQYDPNQPTFSPQEHLAVEWGRLEICRPEDREYFEEIFYGATLVLTRLYHAVRLEGSDLIVLLIPDEFQVDPSLLDEILSAYDYSEELDIDSPQRRLGEFFDQKGIDYVDLLPAFREAREERRLYKVRDTHWNREGNALAARVLADSLMSRVASWRPEGRRPQR